MKHTEDNGTQEKPQFTIEDNDNNASSQEILEEPLLLSRVVRRWTINLHLQP